MLLICKTPNKIRTEVLLSLTTRLPFNRMQTTRECVCVFTLVYPVTSTLLRDDLRDGVSVSMSDHPFLQQRNVIFVNVHFYIVCCYFLLLKNKFDWFDWMKSTGSTVLKLWIADCPMHQPGYSDRKFTRIQWGVMVEIWGSITLSKRAHFLPCDCM